MTAVMTCIGDGMTARQRQEPLVQSHSSVTRLRSGLAGVRIMEEWHGRLDDAPGEEWRERLRSSQQYICELLIENQQLRMSLSSAMKPEPRNPEGFRVTGS
jgi:hypothetical protein